MKKRKKSHFRYSLIACLAIKSGLTCLQIAPSMLLSLIKQLEVTFRLQMRNLLYFFSCSWMLWYLEVSTCIM